MIKIFAKIKLKFFYVEMTGFQLVLLLNTYHTLSQKTQ
jgi:hypothetical protein